MIIADLGSDAIDFIFQSHTRDALAQFHSLFTDFLKNLQPFSLNIFYSQIGDEFSQDFANVAPHPVYVVIWFAWHAPAAIACTLTAEWSEGLLGKIMVVCMVYLLYVILSSYLKDPKMFTVDKFVELLVTVFLTPILISVLIWIAILVIQAVNGLFGGVLQLTSLAAPLLPFSRRIFHWLWKATAREWVDKPAERMLKRILEQ